MTVRSPLVLALPLLLAPLVSTMGAARAANLVGCTGDQPAIVVAAFDEAERRTRLAIEHLAREPDGDLARRWFGTAPRREVRRVLKATLGGLRPGRRPPVSCGDAAGCRDGRTFALARLDTMRMVVCGSFFSTDATMGRDTRFGVLVHEVSHLVAKTKDEAYGPRAAQALARERPRVAVKNADNVEYFVEAMPGRLVRKEFLRAKVPVVP